MVSIGVYKNEKLSNNVGQRVVEQQEATPNEPICMHFSQRHASHAASQRRRASFFQPKSKQDVFRTPRSAPHFTHNLVSNQAPCGLQWERRGDQATENARHGSPATGGRTPSKKFQGTKRGAGLGFSRVSGESPQKIGMVGCETSRGKIRLTMSAFSFPQFTQIHSRIFFTLMMKPR